MHFQPRSASFIQCWLGKFPNPFLSSNIYSELTWDDDVQPEGAAFTLSDLELGRNASIRLVNGSYLIWQFAPNVRKNWLNTSQVSASWQLAEAWNLKLASGFYYFANIAGQSVDDPVFDPNEGNAWYYEMHTDGSDTSFIAHYLSNFHVLDNFSLLEYRGSAMPLLFKIQYIHNFGAAQNNTGFSAGVSYGELRRKNQWRIFYQFHRLNQDAVFTPYAQDDLLRTTNANGHVFALAYAFHRKVSLQAWGMLDSSIEEPQVVQSRWRLDLNVKF